MKKIAFIGLALVAFVFTACKSTDRAQQLKIYNWADYINEDVKSGFEQWYYEQTGEKVEIVYETFETNEAALTKIEMGHEDFDLFCPSEYIIEQMLKKDLLLPLMKDSIPDSIYYFDNISPFVVEKFELMSPGEGVRVSDYTAGYMWGTTGFIYNKEFVDPADLQSWSALLNPKFENRIMLKDAVRDIYSVLVLYAYADQIERGEVDRDDLVRNITPERVAAVKDILMKANKQICGWEVDFGKEEMTKGKAWLNLSWSGDAQYAIQEAAEETGVMLGYVVPKEGSNVWFDGWVIPKYARNVKAATYFIDYMCRADNALANMDEIGYVSCVGGEKAAAEILAEMNDPETWEETVDASYFFGEEPIEVDGEMLDPHALYLDPVYYADKSIIDRCALMHDAGPAEKILTGMWNEIKLAR